MVLLKNNYVEKMNKYIESLKLQIKNSFLHGCSNDNIKIITNFDFEFMGIEAYKIEDFDYSQNFWLCKIEPILQYISNNFDNSVVWYHDLDCWQNQPLSCFEYDLRKYNLNSVGVVQYHYRHKKRPQGGSLLFKCNHITYEVFNNVKKEMCEKHINNEYALKNILSTENNIFKIEELDTSFNIGQTNFYDRIKNTVGKIKCLHFKHEDDIVYKLFEPYMSVQLKEILSGS
jgi:hypothetical protein